MTTDIGLPKTLYGVQTTQEIEQVVHRLPRVRLLASDRITAVQYLFPVSRRRQNYCKAAKVFEATN
nr:hypothetical protein Itr_chr12CG06380 [Ipomoea trifida]